MPAGWVIAFVRMDAGGGHLSLDDKFVVIEKGDVMEVPDSFIVVVVTDEDVASDGGIAEWHVGGPVGGPLIDAAAPSGFLVGNFGGFTEDVVDETDAIEMADDVTVFAPNDLVGPMDIFSTDHAWSESAGPAVPLRQKPIGVLGAKLRESGVVVADDVAATLFKAASADVVARDITFGGGNREVRELERSFVPID